MYCVCDVGEVCVAECEVAEYGTGEFGCVVCGEASGAGCEDGAGSGAELPGDCDE